MWSATRGFSAKRVLSEFSVKGRGAAIDSEKLKSATHSIDRTAADDGELLPLHHSTRNATVGSIRVAARAGQ